MQGTVIKGLLGERWIGKDALQQYVRDINRQHLQTAGGSRAPWVASKQDLGRMQGALRQMERALCSRLAGRRLLVMLDPACKKNAALYGLMASPFGEWYACRGLCRSCVGCASQGGGCELVGIKYLMLASAQAI